MVAEDDPVPLKQQPREEEAVKHAGLCYRPREHAPVEVVCICREVVLEALGLKHDEEILIGVEREHVVASVDCAQAPQDFVALNQPVHKDLVEHFHEVLWVVALCLDFKNGPPLCRYQPSPRSPGKHLQALPFPHVQNVPDF